MPSQREFFLAGLLLCLTFLSSGAHALPWPLSAILKKPAVPAQIAPAAVKFSDLWALSPTGDTYVNLKIPASENSGNLVTIPAGNRSDTATGSAAAHPVIFTANDHEKHCTSFMFKNEGSDASPLSDDCRVIMKNIDGGGSWTIQILGLQRQLVQYGTCAVAVVTVLVPSVFSFSYVVGNGDLIHMIDRAIAMYDTNGKVGGVAWTDCSSNDGMDAIKFSIYHT
ncbi:putative necrosis-inducing factor-domain-containing protein [Diplogelasinospora grovesii]|uniref:Necrosis-inducing factor-domain-containing protein n=1 Tax=Diplogelasinospora grovesii TaxID=303347 RepID=A0AAN6N4T9_9PEZI|nr:putative necrosis-inducing factor-domain-containing protein [Diplogelasinospora grovesii]